MGAHAEATQATTPETVDDDSHHVVCCEDEDVALCGIDVSGVPWGEVCKECNHCIRLEGAMDDDPDDVCSLCPLDALRGCL